MKILILLLFFSVLYSQNYDRGYEVFNRSYKAEFYQDKDSTKYVESVITISKNNKWTYHSELFSKVSLINSWQKIEDQWFAGRWSPLDGYAVIHLICDSVTVKSKDTDNKIIYRRYPITSNDVQYDYWLEFKNYAIMKPESMIFKLYEYCYECKSYHTLYTFEIKLNGKNL